MLVRKFSLAPTQAKIIIVEVILLSNLWVCSFVSFTLTICYSDTFAMNTTDRIIVIFCKSTYCLISRVTTAHISIVTAIVNSDAYHQSPLMDN